MTPEEKVALLKEAGVWDVIGFPTCIDKLFNLIASHEREACAKVCEEGTGEAVQKTTLEILLNERKRIAKAIRDRGDE